jgi:hypothetical protein
VASAIHGCVADARELLPALAAAGDGFDQHAGNQP